MKNIFGLFVTGRSCDGFGRIDLVEEHGENGVVELIVDLNFVDHHVESGLIGRAEEVDVDAWRVMTFDGYFFLAYVEYHAIEIDVV